MDRWHRQNEGASGGGTYTLDNLTDTLCGGRYKGTIELP